MKKKICAVLAMILLACGIPFSASADSDLSPWAEAYQDVICNNDYTDLFEDYALDPNYADLVILHDFDGNCIPELIIGNLGGSSVYWDLIVCTYSDGSVKKIGTMSARRGFDAVVAPGTECHGLFLCFQESGMRMGHYYDIRNGKFHTDMDSMITNLYSDRTVEFSKDPLVKKYFYNYFLDDNQALGELKRLSAENVPDLRNKDWAQFVTKQGYSPLPTVAGFNDVVIGKWYSDAVKYVAEKGYMAGTKPNIFDLNGAVTRATIAQILYAAEGNPAVASSSTFNDVKTGKWYFDAVTWAASKGLVTGYGNGKFGPNDVVTREQLMMVLYKYTQMKRYDLSTSADLSKYSDRNKISKWAVQAVKWGVGHKVISGTNVGIEPKGSATRAQLAVILQAYDANVRK